MRKLLYFIIFLIASCSQSERIPTGVLQPDKMEVVLYDLFLADAVNTERVLRDSALQQAVENRRYFDQVFKIHNITAAQFRKSYSYYQQHPALLRNVTDSLAVMATRKSAAVLTDTTKQNLNGNNIQDTTRPAGN